MYELKMYQNNTTIKEHCATVLKVDTDTSVMVCNVN